MADGSWVIRKYVAGDVEEKIKYWAPDWKNQKKAKRTKSDEKKILKNCVNAEKELARILNANFKKDDMLIGMDYSDEAFKMLQEKAEVFEAQGFAPEDALWKAAQHEMRLFLRRVKRAAPQGAYIKSAMITSDMDGDTKELVRIHHHGVISGCDFSLLQEKWKYGKVFYTPLDEGPDYTAIAKYFIDQVRHMPDEKKYTTSRNLIRPQPIERACIGSAELRVPKGAELLFRSEFSTGRPQYIRYTFKRRYQPGVHERVEVGDKCDASIAAPK